MCLALHVFKKHVSVYCKPRTFQVLGVQQQAKQVSEPCVLGGKMDSECLGRSARDKTSGSNKEEEEKGTPR